MTKNYYFLLLAILFFLPLNNQALTTEGNAAMNTDPDWTIVSIYPVNANASGLAWDGEFIYIGSYGGNMGTNIHRFDPTDGTHELFFSGPQSQAYGLTYDGEFLWTIDRTSPSSTPAYALKLDMEGNVVEQFDLPDHYMSGIAYDNSDFWVATYYPDPGTIYKLSQNADNEYVVESSFTPPSDQPWDIARQGDYLWIAEYNNSELHQVELDGTWVATFPGSNYRTSGVVFDGNFLWYVSRASNGDSFLYKVNLQGGGTPGISVPTEYNFGNVTVSNSSTWNMQISNTGDGELIIENMVFPGETPFSTDATFPVNIAPEESAMLTISFAPAQVMVYEAIATLFTNAPANLEVDISLSGIGLASGPFLHTIQEEIDYGTVRLNSSSRELLFLQNMGDGQLEISGIHIDNPNFYLGYQVVFPIILDPVESIELPLWFQPTTTGIIETEASIMFNNPEQSPVIIDLSGTSADGEYPVGELLWQHNFTGSYDYHAKSIMHIPDINEDGFQDLLVGTRNNYIRAFNGNASGTPDLLWEIELGTVEYPKAMSLGSDINGDDVSDIIVGTAWGDRAVTALSAKTGETLWRFETNMYGMGGWVYMINVKYDFNGNGYLDVIAATGDDGDGTGPKRVFCLNGLNGEIIWQTPVNAAAYSVISVEDINGDGIPDVVAGTGSPANQGKVYGISGANGSILWDMTTAGTAVWALGQLNDITGNGIDDVIAGSFSGMFYLLDVTTGSVEYSGSLGNSIILDFWNAGDLNHDGYTDIIPAYSTIPNAVAISGQDGQVLWTTPISDQSWSVAVLRDITGDGLNDVAVGTLYQNNNVYFIDGSNGLILEEVPFASAVDAIGYLPDITGDNSVEVVAGGRNGFMGVYSGGITSDAEEFQVTFEVKNNVEQMLEGVLINISQTGTNIVTGPDGVATIDLYPGTYSFTANLDDYLTFTGNFQLAEEDLTVEIIMEAADPSYMASFTAMENSPTTNMLEGVNIEIVQTGDNIVTDSDGMASIILEPGTYDYIATKENYFPLEGSFELVDENIQIELLMQWDDTSAEYLINPFLADAYCYPNPLVDHTDLVFTLTKDLSVSLTFYDSNGRIVKSFENLMFPAGENQFRWNGTNQYGEKLGAGMYFYEIKIEDILYRDRVLIIKK